MRAVQYSRFGGPEVLELVEVATPEPGPGELRVRVHTAGLNPVDWKIFTGWHPVYTKSVSFPAGVGSDFFGVVEAIGDDVTGFQLGQAVFGLNGAVSLRGAIADYLVAPAELVLPAPVGLEPAIGGALGIVGRTAAAGIEALQLQSGETVLVTAGASATGLIASQLALRAGAHVLGTASPQKFDLLRSFGIEPIDYHDDLAEALAQHGPVDAVYDSSGRGEVEIALAAGVPANRINTIVTGGDAPAGVYTAGSAHARPDALAELAELAASGELVLPVVEYPLEAFREAYAELMSWHPRGKIVLRLSD